jgi:nucleoside-diphosphate-sugar epimerase
MGKGRARVARLSCVYNDHTDTDGFLPDLLQQIITKQPSLLEIYSSPYFSRDYIYLQDVLDALILIATQGSSVIYNIASGENISNEILFSTLEKMSGCRIQPLIHDKPANPCKISIAKMQNEFTWHPVSVLKQITTILKERIEC